jgi:hypothetical protein
MAKMNNPIPFKLVVAGQKFEVGLKGVEKIIDAPPVYRVFYNDGNVQCFVAPFETAEIWYKESMIDIVTAVPKEEMAVVNQ